MIFISKLNNYVNLETLHENFPMPMSMSLANREINSTTVRLCQNPNQLVSNIS